MSPTPLQMVLGLSLLTPPHRELSELLLALTLAIAALALRERGGTVRPLALALCALGLLFDAAAQPGFAPAHNERGREARQAAFRDCGSKPSRGARWARESPDRPKVSDIARLIQTP